MVEVLLFHHAGGLSPGVVAFADALRDAGHAVRTPDLFGGRTFDDVADGVAYANVLGDETLAALADEAAADLPPGIVLAGMSLGCALATQLLLTRPGAVGALYLYGAVTPRWWQAEWPPDVRAQAHIARDDPWREPEVEAEFAGLGGTEVHVYERGGHLFLEPDRRDYAADSAAAAMERILEFLTEAERSV